MIYNIEVEGGFTGIAKTYEGEVEASEEDISRLLKLMGASEPINPNLRDGLIYHITLFDNEKSIEAYFMENNLPDMFRHLISN